MARSRRPRCRDGREPAVLRGLVEGAFGKAAADAVRILYGGSVKPDNVDELMRIEPLPPEEEEQIRHRLEDHFDELGIWRYIELKKTIYRLPDDDLELRPWFTRLAEVAGEVEHLHPDAEEVFDARLVGVGAAPATAEGGVGRDANGPTGAQSLAVEIDDLGRLVIRDAAYLPGAHRATDAATKFVTRNLACVPVLSARHDQVIGVVTQKKAEEEHGSIRKLFMEKLDVDEEVADILIAVTDGLKGLPEALSAVFPATTLQTWPTSTSRSC